MNRHPWLSVALLAFTVLVVVADTSEASEDSPDYIQTKIAAGIHEQSSPLSEEVDSIRAFNEADDSLEETSLPPTDADYDTSMPSLKIHDIDVADEDEGDDDEEGAREQLQDHEPDTAEVASLKTPTTNEQSTDAELSEEDAPASDIPALNTPDEPETEQSLPVVDLAEEEDEDAAIRALRVAQAEGPFYGPHSDLAPGADVEEQIDEPVAEPDLSASVENGKMTAHEQSVPTLDEADDEILLETSLNTPAEADSEQTMPILDPADPSLHDADEFPSLNQVLVDWPHENDTPLLE